MKGLRLSLFLVVFLFGAAVTSAGQYLIVDGNIIYDEDAVIQILKAFKEGDSGLARRLINQAIAADKPPVIERKSIDDDIARTVIGAEHMEPVNFLKNSYPSGYVVYQADSVRFKEWLYEMKEDENYDCIDPFAKAGVALHESVHGSLNMNANLNNFHFGSYLLPENKRFTVELTRPFPPSEIGPYLEPSFYNNDYIFHESNIGEDSFTWLVDEWVAYSYSLEYELALFANGLFHKLSFRSLRALQSFMMYISLYIKVARDDHSKQWQIMRQDSVMLDLIASMWNRSVHLSKEAENTGVFIGDTKKEEAEGVKKAILSNFPEMERFFSGTGYEILCPE